MKLEITSTLRTAALRSWDRRVALAKALAFPALSFVFILFLLSVAVGDVDDVEPESLLPVLKWVLLAYLPFWILSAIYAISVHRTILLGPESLPNRWGFYLSSRVVRFMAWAFALAVVGGLANLPFAFLDSFVAMAVPESAEWVSSALLDLPMMYLLARWALVFPATAIDEACSMAEAWRLTRGNGWRLTLALVIPVWICDAAFSWISYVHSLLAFAGTFLWILVGAIEVATLSVAYEWFKELDALSSTNPEDRRRTSD